MKGNKGFTLIELLAVILVLGIIALIAVSTINTSIKTAKIKSGEVSVSGLVKSIETKKVENEVKGETDLKSGYYLKSELENLEISETKNFENVLIEFGEDGSVKGGTFCVNDLSYSYDGDKVIYQEYANFCNGKNTKESSNVKLINGGYILDEDGNLYAIGALSYLKYGGDASGDVASSIYKKVDTGGIKFKDIVSDDTGAYAAISTDNKLYAWGNSGGLGIPDTYWVTVDTPTLVSESIEFKEVQLGHGSGIGIDTSGQLYTWGFDCYGFGDGRTQVETPIKILNGIDIVSIATFYDVNLAIDATGDMYIWGDDTGGFAGNGVRQQKYPTPTKVLTGYNFKGIYSGLYNKFTSFGSVYAIDKDGNLWGWGENNQSQIKQYETQFITTPYKITDNVKKVIGNYNMLAVLKNDNSLYLGGIARKMIDGETVGLLKYQDNVKDISIHKEVIYYLSMDNKLYSFGINDGYGILGIGISNYYHTPTKINFKVKDSLTFYSDRVVKNDILYEYDYSSKKYNYVKDAKDVKSLFQYGGAAYALKNDGSIEELGCRSGYEKICASFKNNFANKKIEYVTTTSNSAFMIDSKNNIYSTGTYYDVNNLGYKATAQYYYYGQLLSGKKFKRISANGDRAFTLTTGNILYGWGKNDKGQLANGTTTNQVTPIKISENIIDYYDNYSNIFFVDGNNDLYYSGYMNQTDGNQTALKKIDSNIEFSKIYTNTVFGDKDGCIYGYGDNYSSELGIGNNIQLTQFTKLLGGKKVRDVYDFDNVYYYITTNNELYVAGKNSTGKLGLGKKITEQNTYTLLMKNVDNIVNMCEHANVCDNSTAIINTLSGDTYMLGKNNWDKDLVVATKPISISLYN